MKDLIFWLIIVLGAIIGMCQPTKVAERDLEFEAYCDSIYVADPDYYFDVLVETDEYQQYIEIHGEW